MLKHFKQLLCVKIQMPANRKRLKGQTLNAEYVNVNGKYRSEFLYL